MNTMVYSTLPFLHLNPLEAVKVCLLNGAEKVEVFMEGPQWSSLTDAERLTLAIELNQLPCQYSVHPPQFDLNLSSNWPVIREAALKEYRKAIHFAGSINASHLVIDPGVRHLPRASLKEAREAAKKGIEALLLDAGLHKVRIGIENGPVARQLVFTDEDYGSFVQSFRHPLVGAVLDTGHARLAGWDIGRVIERLGENLLAVHLNDTSGRVDNHLPLGSGVIDWQNVCRALDNLTGKPDLVLELNTETQAAVLRKSSNFIQSMLAEKDE